MTTVVSLIFIVMIPIDCKITNFFLHLHKMLAWIQFWEFIIFEVIKFELFEKHKIIALDKSLTL